MIILSIIPDDQGIRILGAGRSMFLSEDWMHNKNARCKPEVVKEES